MAEPIKPVSRLEDASLGNSNAIAEARRASSSERQSMAVERTMQRQYRRAVRRNDLQTISVLGSQMSDMGLSRTGGGGIQNSQENNRVASERAFNRADLLNQAGGRGGAAPESQKPAPHPFAPNVGQGAANDIEAAAGAPEAAKRTTNGQTGNGTINPNARPAGTADQRESRLLPENNPVPSQTGQKKLLPRAQFIADLDKSQLFKDGDSDAIERAVTRGERFGISRDQVLARQQGGDATLSGIAREKEMISKQQSEAGTDVVLGPEAPPEDSLIAQAQRIQQAGSKSKELTNEGMLATVRSQDRTRKFKDKLDSGAFDRVIEPPIVRIPSAKINDPVFKELDPKSDEYWAVNPNQISSMKKMENDGTNAYMGADSSDPRFPVMKLIQDAEVMMNDAYSFRDAKRKVYNALGQIGAVQKDGFYSDENARKQRQEMVDHEVIWNAAKEGIDLTGYARHRGPQFFKDYQEAKNVQTRINSAWFHAEEIKARAANLIPSR